MIQKICLKKTQLFWTFYSSKNPEKKKKYNLF